MKRRTLLETAPALLLASGLAGAQSAYPSKPIRYIVPVAAGGGSDMVGRTVTERWGQQLKQSFIVDNRGGDGARHRRLTAGRNAGTVRQHDQALSSGCCGTCRSDIGSLQKPMTDGQLEAKFHALSDPVLGLQQTSALIGACWNVGAAPNVKDLVALACTTGG